MRVMSALARKSAGTVVLFTLVLVWWWLSTEMGPLRLPSPWAVLTTLIDTFVHSETMAAQTSSGAGFGVHLGFTVLKFAIGVGGGLLLGISAGLAMAYEVRLGWLLDTPIAILRAVPPLALIPFMIVWFGTGPDAQIALLVTYVSVIMIANTINAVGNLGEKYQRFASTLGASRLRVFKTVVLPGIVPELLGGLRVLFAFSWGLLVVGELIGGEYGIGRILTLMVPLLKTSEIIATVLLVVMVAIGTDRIVVWLYSRATPWAESSSSEVR